ncbi:MAG TPA: GDSL-type esterase/lipase family protein [Burkholderiaceae bacterium]|nr:GDSL-type esterase/lipase family protein [Burkholderiaceae bacterium]
MTRRLGACAFVSAAAFAAALGGLAAASPPAFGENHVPPVRSVDAVAPERADPPAPVTVPLCIAPMPQLGLRHPLPRVAQRLTEGEPLRIVAIGSSSTAGAGATSPARNYPNRLAEELRRRLPDQPIDVLNRGVNGEEVADMLRRFDRDVLAARPDLVIWQVGTNALLRSADPDRFAASVQHGLDKLRSQGIDVVLMDLQYAPAVLAAAGHREMLARLETIGERNRVPVFRRFAAMKAWTESAGAAAGAMICDDGLHLTDLGYGCLAYQLASAILPAAGSAAAVAAR